MKLSMAMIKHCFNGYELDYSICSNDRNIAVLRFKDNLSKFADDTLYISVELNQLILENRNDHIKIYTDNPTGALNHLWEKISFYNDWANGLRARLYSINKEDDILEASIDIFPDSIIMLSDTSYYTHAFEYKKKGINIISLIERVNEKRDLDLNSIIDIEKNPLVKQHKKEAFSASLSDGSIKGSKKNIFSDNEFIAILMISNMEDTVSQGCKCQPLFYIVR